MCPLKVKKVKEVNTTILKNISYIKHLLLPARVKQLRSKDFECSDVVVNTVVVPDPHFLYIIRVIVFFHFCQDSVNDCK